MRYLTFMITACMVAVIAVIAGVAQAHTATPVANTTVELRVSLKLPELACSELASDYDESPEELDTGVTLPENQPVDTDEQVLDGEDQSSSDEFGTEEDEALGGSEDDDKIFGAGGDDDLCGEAGDDWLSGGSGSDKIDAGEHDDSAQGGKGRDFIFGAGGNDVLRGDAGNDDLVGGKGRDKISGGAGNDRIDAKDGVRDTVKCGAGKDVVYADRRDVVAKDCERVK